ncbi:MAG TPA: asparagine synthase-related protein [Polyangia bacterium]|nr:asparagine synthase-related protein [Polyangia bacterium]
MMERDPLGLRRLYYRQDGSAACTLRALVASGPIHLDPLGVAFAFGETPPTEPPTDHTWVRGVRRVPAGHRLLGTPGHWRTEPCPSPPASLASKSDDLAAALLDTLAEVVTSERRVALALSGGLDSALLLALLHEHLRDRLPAIYVLAPRLSGGAAYDESAAALALAHTFGLRPEVVTVHEDDLLAALPACVRAAETPLYNAHPVARFCLLDRLAHDGIEVVLTGDGADQAFAGAPAEIYLPIVGALADAHGLTLACPFLAPRVLALAAEQPPDPTKQKVRAAARGRLPDALVDAPKTPRLAPPLDLGRYWDAPSLEHLARALDRPQDTVAAITTDRQRMAWVTLALLCTSLGLTPSAEARP